MVTRRKAARFALGLLFAFAVGCVASDACDVVTGIAEGVEQGATEGGSDDGA